MTIECYTCGIDSVKLAYPFTYKRNNTECDNTIAYFCSDECLDKFIDTELNDGEEETEEDPEITTLTRKEKKEPSLINSVILLCIFLIVLIATAINYGIIKIYW